MGPRRFAATAVAAALVVGCQPTSPDTPTVRPDTVGPTARASTTSTPSPAPSEETLDLMSTTFTGWQHTGAGEFVLDADYAEPVYRTSGGLGLLWYDRVLTDFILRFDLLVPDQRTNSGVFLRIPEPPTDTAYISTALELQIDTEGTDLAATGALYSVAPPLEVVELSPGTWHDVEITVIRDRIIMTVDGRVVQDARAATGGKVTSISRSGYIGLQNHGDADVARFRRIELVDLSEGPNS